MISVIFFYFDIVNFPYLNGDGPHSTSYGVYVSQHIRSARVSSHVTDFSAGNKILTGKLLHQGCRYHQLRKTVSKLYRRHNELVSKFKDGLRSLPSIFRDKSVQSSIPNYFKNCEVPIIYYKYNKPIRGAIFNFNKLVSDLDIETCFPDS